MAKMRMVVRVVPNKQGGWRVKKGNRIISNHRKKTTAVQKGKGVAKKQQPSQIVIHKKDGKIQTEHTYKQDPYPPKG